MLGGSAGRIQPLDLAVARRAVTLHVPDPRPERDALIAATALEHLLVVVTRNVSDFSELGVDVVDPWRHRAQCGSGLTIVPCGSVMVMAQKSRVPEPPDGDERGILLGWLAFHRNALEANCEGLDATQLATRSVPPSPLSLLGLVRHITEMERAYAAWALGPDVELEWVWGEYTDDGPEWDIDVDASMLADSMSAWEREQRVADQRIASHVALESVGEGNGRSLRWNLQKLIGEYARHNGHADLIRERIDGQTGE